MRTSLYSIRDRLTQTFFPPFHATHDIAAARAIVQLIQDPKSAQSGNNVALYPAEHDLVRVCSFDDVEGIIFTDEKPVTLARCDQLAKDKRYFPEQPS